MAKTTTAERYRREIKMLADESPAWESIWERAEFGVKFLMDGRHYSDAQEKASLDSEDIRWVHEDAFNRLRHESGVVVRPGVLSAMPVDLDGDSDMADVACKAVLSDLDQPEMEFDDAWYDIVNCGSAAGYGTAWLDFVPDGQGGGQFVFEADDPRNFMCDRRVKSIHSRRPCRFVVRRVRMTKGEALLRCGGKNGWNEKLCKQLIGDEGHDGDYLWRQANRDAMDTTQAVVLREEPDAAPDETDDSQECTFYYIWRINAPDTEDVQGDYQELDPEDRYMRCSSCGYRTEPQGMLPPNDNGDPQELPQSLEGGCPACMDSGDINRHGNMERVNGMPKVHEMIKYPNGYLCVIAPYALPGVEDFIYEGGWPCKLRSYPAVFLPRFRHPFRVTGPSIADLTAWNTIATDMLMRVVLERMMSVEPAQVLPLDAFFDARGNPWETSTERSLGAFYIGQSIPQTGLIQGDPGIPSAWSPIYQAARAALTSAQGIADFSISEGQSRDIPAQSAALQIRQEEIPVSDYRRRYEHQRSILIGIYYDYKRAVAPHDALYRVAGQDGDEQVTPVSLGDLPNFSFKFSSDPDMEPQDERQAAATDQLIAAIEQRPWATDLIAYRNKMAPSLVRKAKGDYARFQQQQQAAMPPGQIPGQPPPPNTGPTPGTPPGAGAPPQQGVESPSAMVARLLAMGPQQAGG